MEKKPYEGYLIISDMDGTLLDSDHKISRENIDALNGFVGNGGKFTVATGRNEDSVKLFLRDIPINAPAILYNGALIYDMASGKRLWQDFIDNGVEQAIKDVLEKFPETGIEIYSEEESYFLRENNISQEHSKRLGSAPKTAELKEIPRPWYKVMLLDEHERLNCVKRYLDDNYNCFRSVFSEPQFLELLGAGTSKGNALKRLTAILGMDMSGVISIGDNLNDVEMILYAGVGVAVRNAHKELIQIADYCSGTNDEHALRNVIRWLANRDNRIENIL